MDERHQTTYKDRPRPTVRPADVGEAPQVSREHRVQVTKADYTTREDVPSPQRRATVTRAQVGAPAAPAPEPQEAPARKGIRSLFGGQEKKERAPREKGKPSGFSMLFAKTPEDEARAAARKAARTADAPEEPSLPQTSPAAPRREEPARVTKAAFPSDAPVERTPSAPPRVTVSQQVPQPREEAPAEQTPSAPPRVTVSQQVPQPREEAPAKRETPVVKTKAAPSVLPLTDNPKGPRENRTAPHHGATRRAVAALASAAFLFVSVPVAVGVAESSAAKEVQVQEVAEEAPAEEVNFRNTPVQATPVPLATQMASPSLRIAAGQEDAVITQVQERLMELSYMDWDEPTTLYGPHTQTALNLFQKKNGMETPEDNSLQQECYDLLMSDAAQSYVASEGDDGEDIKDLQIRLRELGYLDKATGHFGSDTLAAVQKFQSLNNLNVDGKIGTNTKELLYSEEAKANAYSLGEESEKIRTYQNRLKKLGYLTTEPDGKYGNDTVTAVRRFQEINGLIADGWLGTDTINLLMSDDAEGNALKFGSRGNDVVRVQERLKELKYLSNKATGYYGSATEDAVYTFQKTNKLNADGKVGRQTMNVLMSSSAKKYAGKTYQKPASSSSNKNNGSSGSSSSKKDPVKITGTNADSLVAVAASKIGCKYVRGAKGPDKFDCSGFVYWCLNQVGIKQGYLTSYGWRSVTKYEKIKKMSDVRKGDILVYYGHVGLAISDSTMIDASSSNGKIVKRTFHGNYWRKNWICAYRLF